MEGIKKYLTKESIIRLIYELFVVSIIIIPSITMPMFKETPLIITKCMTLSYFFELFFCIPVLFGYELFVVYNKLRDGYKNNYEYVNRFLIFVICIVCILLFTKNTNILCYAFLIYFSKEISFKRLIYIYLLCKFVGLIVIVLSNVFGLVEIVTDGRGISFGVKHSNVMARYLVCMLFAGYYFIKNNTITKVLTVLVFILCVFVMKSRTPVIVLILFMFALFLENSKLLSNKIVRMLFVFSPVILTLLSILLGIAMYNGYFVIDGNMACRFTEWISAFNISGISLFARTFPDLPYYFDNCYANVFYCYGIVMFVLFILTWIKSNITINKSNNNKLKIISICLCIYCLMEVLIADILIILVFCYANKENADTI